MIFTAQPEASTNQAAAGRVPARPVPAEMCDTFLDVAKEVRTKVVQHLQGASTPYPLTDQGPASEDEEASHTNGRRGLKSGKVSTIDSVVVKRVQWSHEMVFTNQGQPPVYGELSMALFTNGYLSVLAAEMDINKAHMCCHLQELMEDAEVNGWKVVRDYHAALLRLMEQGRAASEDDNKKDKLRRLLVWSRPALGARQPPNSNTTDCQPSQAQGISERNGYYSQPSKPGDKAYQGLTKALVLTIFHIHWICMCVIIASK